MQVGLRFSKGCGVVPGVKKKQSAVGASTALSLLWSEFYRGCA